jgi:hypothetical protein
MSYNSSTVRVSSCRTTVIIDSWSSLASPIGLHGRVLKYNSLSIAVKDCNLRNTDARRVNYVRLRRAKTDGFDIKTNSVAVSPQANFTGGSTATCRRNLVPTFVDRGVSRGQMGMISAVGNTDMRRVFCSQHRNLALFSLASCDYRHSSILFVL